MATDACPSGRIGKNLLWQRSLGGQCQLAPKLLLVRIMDAPTAVTNRHEDFASTCLPYRNDLYAVAMRFARNPADAADLVQETMLRAMVAWNRFEPGTNARGWLVRILINSFINGYRKKRRHKRLAEQQPLATRLAIFGQDDDFVPDHGTVRRSQELSEEVSSAMANLGADYREVVVRADLAGKAYQDIADDLCIPIGTVMSRLFRARRRLQAELRDYASEQGIGRAA